MTKKLVPAEIVREGARRLVNVQGAQMTVAANKSEAVSFLCKLAIERREPFIVTVREGAGKTYLAISEMGEVRTTTAPAPTSVRPDPTEYAEHRDLGASPAEVDDTRVWVEETMLASGDEQRPVKPKRFGFGRRK